jgi:hypothetical protein
MDAIRQHQTVFHLTGRAPAAPLEPIATERLRPALLSRYRDLARLRYDFPVVLTRPAGGEPFALALRDIVNTLIAGTVPAGAAGEALRKHLLRVEREIRRAAAAGASAMLSEMWAEATAPLAADDEALREFLARAGEEIDVDGVIADCDERLPRTLFRHAWRVVHEEKQARARADIDALVMKLSDILRADFVRSEAGRRPEALKAAMGARQQALFDFDAMARLLAGGAPAGGLSPSRRARIEGVLDTLRSQRFFPAPLPAAEPPYEFDFDTCRGVQQAFEERLPAMAELVRAMSIAELECEGDYEETKHDAFFAAFGPDTLSTEDMRIFPDYLVCLRGRPTDTVTDTHLMQLLSSGIPVKILVEVDDVLEESSAGRGGFAFGVRSVQLASLAIGLNDVFVLQSPSAGLLQMQAGIRRGLEVPAPALFSVYTATATPAGGLPRYLVSAAALQSRAFPAFIYDPTAGADLAARFSLEHNPQPDGDWAASEFEYADESLQRVSKPLAFTLADFVLTDTRYAHHFARVPHEAWNDRMIPVADWLAGTHAAADGWVPSVPAVDDEDFLQRLVVDDRLIQATQRCLQNWNRLQELSGLRNSHVERVLARARAAWEAERDAQAAAQVAPPLAQAAAQHAASPPPAAPGKAGNGARAEVSAGAAEPVPATEDEPARNPDEAWIETLRCSTCNECTQVNGQMFAYNENQQAYIKDITAGTYRELVEAAESCQVSVIHPGKPRDPNEPGLEELLERAKPFL